MVDAPVLAYGVAGPDPLPASAETLATIGAATLVPPKTYQFVLLVDW